MLNLLNLGVRSFRHWIPVLVLVGVLFLTGQTASGVQVAHWSGNGLVDRFANPRNWLLNVVPGPTEIISLGSHLPAGTNIEFETDRFTPAWFDTSPGSTLLLGGNRLSVGIMSLGIGQGSPNGPPQTRIIGGEVFADATLLRNVVLELERGGNFKTNDLVTQEAGTDPPNATTSTIVVRGDSELDARSITIPAVGLGADDIRTVQILVDNGTIVGDTVDIYNGYRTFGVLDVVGPSAQWSVSSDFQLDSESQSGESTSVLGVLAGGSMAIGGDMILGARAPNSSIDVTVSDSQLTVGGTLSTHGSDKITVDSAGTLIAQAVDLHDGRLETFGGDDRPTLEIDLLRVRENAEVVVSKTTASIGVVNLVGGNDVTSQSSYATALFGNSTTLDASAISIGGQDGSLGFLGVSSDAEVRVGGQTTIFENSILGIIDGGTYSTDSLHIRGELTSDPDNALGISDRLSFKTGTLEIVGGTFSLENSDDVFSVDGAAAGDHATLTLKEGATAALDKSVLVGETHEGSINILSGSTLSSASSTLGVSGFGHGTVSGSGTRWVHSNTIIVGAFGQGDLLVSDGGTLKNRVAFVGAFSGSSGVATIAGMGADGAEATWQTDESLYIGGEINGGNGTGTLNVEDGGRVSVAEKLKIWDDGTVNLAGGTLDVAMLDLTSPTASDGFNMTGGRLVTDSIVGDLQQDGGTLAPGSTGAADMSLNFATGTLTIEGSFMQSSTSDLEIQLAGLLLGDFDRLEISGDALVAGTLSLSSSPEFTLGTGLAFDILDVEGSFDGQFAGLGEGSTVGTLNGTDLRITYLAGDGNDVALFTDSVSSLTGDFDVDGDVDGDDIDFYSGVLGQAATGDLAQLDLDSDGMVTLSDHDLHVTKLVAVGNVVEGTFLGDIDLDGTVNVLEDAFALVSNLGTNANSWSQGDLNADGQVDVLGDAFRLVSNLGKSKTNLVGGVRAVPEPNASILMFCCLLGKRFGSRSRGNAALNGTLIH